MDRQSGRRNVCSKKMNAILKYQLILVELDSETHSYTPLPNKNIDTGVGV